MYTIRVAMESVARLKAHIQLRGSAVSRPSPRLRATRGKATIILSKGDFTQTVDSVKAFTVCHVFSFAERPVASDSVARVKGALQRLNLQQSKVYISLNTRI